MFNVGCYINFSKRFASDVQPEVIMLLEAIALGWHPPKDVSVLEYRELQSQLYPTPMRGFVGFGCSHSGKFFGGYARNSTNRNYAENASNSLRKMQQHYRGVQFAIGSYLDLKIEAEVIYCDPPYAKTTQYACGDFDSIQFWDWVRERSKRSKVFVSEYTAPDDFLSIWSKLVTTDMKEKYLRKEHLFVHKDLFL